MRKRFHKRRFNTRRIAFNASKWQPLFKLLAVALGSIAALAFVTLLVMVLLESVFHIDTPLKPDGIIAHLTQKWANEDILVVTPTPYFTPEPTDTPHPMVFFDPEEEEREVVLSPEFQYRWFGDPSINGNKMLFSAGRLVGTDANMCALLMYDLESRTVLELPVKLSNSHFIYPAFNDEWLVYLDANAEGGGDICAYRFDRLDADPILIKTVYTGQPEIRLDGHYISWIERTGTSRDKLFVCDLETQETAVLDIFTSSSYGTSAPYMKDGAVIWAAEGDESIENGGTTSVIRHIDIGSSEIKDYEVDMYVHDPEFNHSHFAWIDAHHSESSTLYIAELNCGILTNVKAVASGVIDFAMDEHYIAYSIDDAIYVYLIKSKESFRVSPARELAQLLGASCGKVIWMDVTTRERDVLKFVDIPSD